jgi:transposase
VIAGDALASPEIRRLMSVPGVNVITAATFVAAIGDVLRFPTPRRVVGYLGLDPRVRQSGPGPAKTAGSQSSDRRRPATRSSRPPGAWCASPVPCAPSMSACALVAVTRVAIVATARKWACLFWCLLTREEDYAYAQPSLTKKKLRRLELTAGAERGKVKPGIWSTNKALGKAERELGQQAESPTGGRWPTGSRKVRRRARVSQWGAIS